jgi:hypothetical protein
MTFLTCCREVEVEFGALSCVGAQLEWLGHHVFCFINWHRSDRNLVQQVELLYIWGYIRHNHFAAVGCVDQELIRYCLIFILLTLAILPCISMGHHEVLLEVNLYILDFFLEHNKITSSCDCQSSRLICLSLVVSALQSWRQ